MVPELIVEFRVFLDADFQVSSPQQDQFIQTLELNRFHEPLGIGVATGRPRRTEHDLNPGVIQQRLEFIRVFRISINDQMALAGRESKFVISQVSRNLLHPLPVWIGSASADMNQSALQLDHKQRVVGHQS